MRYSYKWLIAAGIGAVVVSAGSVAYRWLNEPAVVTEVRSGNTMGVSEELPVNRELASPHFSTQVPSNLTLRSQQQQPTATITERYVLAAGAPEGHQLAITIAPLPPGGLTEVPSVVLRLRNPSTYLKETASYVPEDALLFSADTDTFEQTIFMSNERKYAAVAVSGRADRSQQLRTLLETTIREWRWR
jgi:hypothetical protein